MELAPEAVEHYLQTFQPLAQSASTASHRADLSVIPTRESALRRSLGVVTLGWIFGAVWSTMTTGAPLTQFARSLSASPFQFGLLSALPFIASVASLPASLLTERTGKRKRIFLSGLYLQRLLWAPIALAPLWMICRSGPSAAPRALGVFLVLTFLMHACGAVGSPAWVSWMADVVPDRLRGKYFSRRRQWGILTAIPAALFVGWFLDHRVPLDGGAETLRWGAILFLCAAVFGLADIHLFQFVPHTNNPPQNGRALLKALAEPLRDRQFLCFGGFVATLTFAVSFMGQFATLFVIDQVKVDNTAAQIMLVVAPMIAQLLVLPLWGAASDRMGKKPLLVLASIGLVPVGLGWCLVGPGSAWLGYILSGLGAALWTGVEIANFNQVLDLSGRRSNAPGASQAAPGGSSYVAVNSVIVNIAGCLGGIAAGLIAQSLSNWHWHPIGAWKTLNFYDVLFALSGLLRLAALALFIPFLHEPTARSAWETLRFMAAFARSELGQTVVRFVRRQRPQPSVKLPTTCRSSTPPVFPPALPPTIVLSDHMQPALTSSNQRQCA